MQLWLVRHAQPLIGAGICYGALDVAADVALTAAAAKSLATALPENTLCRISPLRRCQQLAAALAKLRPDLAINSSACTDTRLAEMDFGVFEGQAWATISKVAMDEWTADFGNHRFGGNESANEVLQRIKAALDDCAAANTRNVLWITHAGVIRSVNLLKQGIHRLDSPEQWPRKVVEFGAYMTVDYDS
jgi:alpha-ribazole phosphatase